MVSAIACVEIDGEEHFLILMNQACYYDYQEQTESLCHPYQAMLHGVKFCLTPKENLTTRGNPGNQKMIVDEREIPLSYDGRKMFLKIRKPSQEEIDTLEMLEITSPDPFDPESINEGESTTRRDEKKI